MMRNSLYNAVAGVQQRMKERGCRDIGELLEKIKEDKFQEEVYRRRRLKALGLLGAGE